MRKVMPGWHGVDVISFPKLIGLQSHQSTYAVTAISYNDVSSSLAPAAIAIADSQVLQKILPSLSSLEEYRLEYAFDYRTVNEQTMMIAISKTALQSELDKHPFLQIKIVDTESSCVQRCLQKIFLIESAAFIILLIDQTECRFYVLQRGNLLFKYRELLSSDITVSVQRCWKLFVATLTNFPLEQVYLAGDHQQLHDFIKIVQQVVSMPVLMINPFDHLVFDTSLDKTEWYARGPAFVVACGLALRGVSQ